MGRGAEAEGGCLREVGVAGRSCGNQPGHLPTQQQRRPHLGSLWPLVPTDSCHLTGLSQPSSYLTWNQALCPTAAHSGVAPLPASFSLFLPQVGLQETPSSPHMARQADSTFPLAPATCPTRWHPKNIASGSYPQLFSTSFLEATLSPCLPSRCQILPTLYFVLQLSLPRALTAICVTCPNGKPAFPLSETRNLYS